MDNVPIFYQMESLQEYFNLQPSSVKGRANGATEYNKRYLYNIVYSVFKFTLPSDWKLNFFRYWLFQYGSIAVIYTREYGWICNPYGIEKLDYTYNPRVINVTNAFLQESKKGVIGVNAGIVKLFDDYYGIDDLVTHYAEQLAQIDRSVNVNLMNANITKAFCARDKKQAEDIKEAYGDATSGKPLVLINKNVLDGKDNALVNLFGDVKGDYICDLLLTAKRQIINEFLTRIGIRNANYEKKERLNSQEVSENNDETRSIVSVMLENVQTSFSEINAISDLGLAVELRYDYDGGDLLE